MSKTYRDSARIKMRDSGERNPNDYAEFWSDRPFNKSGGATGKFAKTRTHRAERSIAKQTVKEETKYLDS